MKKTFALIFTFIFSLSALAGVKALENTKDALDAAIKDFSANNTTEKVEDFRAIKIWRHADDYNIRFYLQNSAPVEYTCGLDTTEAIRPPMICTLID